MKIKAIIMDGDGSTITHDNLVPDNLKATIINTSQIKWIMATGRSLELLNKTPIFDYLSNDVPHIVDGGSCLMFLNGQCKTKHMISQKYLDILFGKLNLEKTNFLYYSPDGKNSYVYSAIKDFRSRFKFHDEFVTYTACIKEFESWANQYPPSKILLNVKNEFDLKGLYFHKNENNYDITDNNINKGTACVTLLNELNLLPEEVVFIFNDKNDLPIINNPLLKNIIKIKVGDYLPDIISDYYANTPYEVATVIQQVLV